MFSPAVLSVIVIVLDEEVEKNSQAVKEMSMLKKKLFNTFAKLLAQFKYYCQKIKKMKYGQQT